MKKVQQKSSIIIASSFVLISLICLLVACGSDESKLVGKWINENEGESDLELFKDGTGIFKKMSINWKVDSDRFIVTSSLFGFSYNYTVSDSTLTLTDDKGKSVEYDNFSTHHIERRIAERDKKKYKTVKIGNQVWMAENLNYKAIGSKCYNNESANCDKYGRLYDWNVARNACPKGWHLPDTSEWNRLLEAVGGNKTAGKHLKAASGWDDYNYWNKNTRSNDIIFGNGSDTYGFTAMPGGEYSSTFHSAGSYTGLWSVSETDDNHAYSLNIDNDEEGIRWDNDNKNYFFSVRCLQN